MVTIETAPSSGSVVRCQLAVERRGDVRRREGHAPPVIAEASAPTQQLAFRELYGIASDNVAVARGLLVWQAHRSSASHQRSAGDTSA